MNISIIAHGVALYVCLPLWALLALASSVAYLIVEATRKRRESLDKDGIRRSGRWAE